MLNFAAILVRWHPFFRRGRTRGAQLHCAAQSTRTTIMTFARTPTTRPAPLTGIIVFLLIAVMGLFYVKWFPYYNRAFVAQSHHSIGHSILMGDAAQAPTPSFQSALDYAWAYGKAIWQAMVLGLLLGSAVQELLPRRWIANVLGKTRFGSVVAGGLLSIPGMMCTCCAAPVVVGLRKSHASVGAALAFWLGNTILNPATLIFMGFVLGWQWTGLRLGLGLMMVFGIGYWVNRAVRPEEAQIAKAQLDLSLADPDQAPSFSRWLKKLGSMTVRLIPEYVVLVLLLGAARAWLFPHISPAIGNQLGWIVAMAIAGTVFVNPTAGEVPIIQAMLSLGMGVGPAGALLMTLAPISLPSLVMTRKAFPPRVIAGVVAAVVAIGIVSGLLTIALGF
jgi:uncharacterized membrane protein YraQ (UPF0718 family)